MNHRGWGDLAHRYAMICSSLDDDDERILALTILRHIGAILAGIVAALSLAACAAAPAPPPAPLTWAERLVVADRAAAPEAPERALVAIRADVIGGDPAQVGYEYTFLVPNGDAVLVGFRPGDLDTPRVDRIMYGERLGRAPFATWLARDPLLRPIPDSPQQIIDLALPHAQARDPAVRIMRATVTSDPLVTERLGIPVAWLVIFVNDQTRHSVTIVIDAASRTIRDVSTTEAADATP